MAYTVASVSHFLACGMVEFRQSKGVSAALWSGDADYGWGSGDAFEAQMSNNACIAQNALVHTAYERRADLRAYGIYLSDILQYATYMKKPSDVIASWGNSTGYRRMMQCNTTHHAGVAVAKSGGRYCFTIVYERNNYNQSGS